VIVISDEQDEYAPIVAVVVGLELVDRLCLHGS
jgi:hypothetical protein